MDTYSCNNNFFQVYCSSIITFTLTLNIIKLILLNLNGTGTSETLLLQGDYFFFPSYKDSPSLRKQILIHTYKKKNPFTFEFALFD